MTRPSLIAPLVALAGMAFASPASAGPALVTNGTFNQTGSCNGGCGGVAADLGHPGLELNHWSVLNTGCPCSCGECCISTSATDHGQAAAGTSNWVEFGHPGTKDTGVQQQIQVVKNVTYNFSFCLELPAAFSTCSCGTYNADYNLDANGSCWHASNDPASCNGNGTVFDARFDPLLHAGLNHVSYCATPVNNASLILNVDGSLGNEPVGDAIGIANLSITPAGGGAPEVEPTGWTTPLAALAGVTLMLSDRRRSRGN